MKKPKNLKKIAVYIIVAIIALVLIYFAIWYIRISRLVDGPTPPPTSAVNSGHVS